MAKAARKRNESAAATRKLEALAKATGLPIDLLKAMADLTWDYDPEFGEAKGWVDGKHLGAEAQECHRCIAVAIGLPFDFKLTPETAAKELVAAHRKLDVRRLWRNFLRAASRNDYANLSEFTSYHYLRGVNAKNVTSLEGWKREVGLSEIAGTMFLKPFRGGTFGSRNCLLYNWCDLVIDWPYAEDEEEVEPWFGAFLDQVDALPEKSSLGDLVKCCSGLVGGNKYFKQAVLEALCFADVLRVNDVSVIETFLPDADDDLPGRSSPEWEFPLSYWSGKGGSVNRDAMPKT